MAGLSRREDDDVGSHTGRRELASRTESKAGRFRIDAELARGGMGVVFAATDGATGARVALKRLLPGATAQMESFFEREFHVLASLEHPRIIEVHEYGTDEEGPFYTMELLEGSDLRELAPLGFESACRYLRDVASSLALLHARRLLHRDVSPRNVRTSSDGGCKLIDFGALTSFGVARGVVGTPPAMPPEAVFGQAMDQRSDLFSLGALAYWLLTGRHAYPAGRVSELTEFWAVPPAPPSTLAPDVPPELDQLVLSLLNLDMLARPVSAAEVIARLDVIGRLSPEHEGAVAHAYLRSTSLVERSRELQHAYKRILRAKRGRGASLFVEAGAGVGKSRFLDEVALRAQIAGLLVLRAAGGAQTGRLSTARALFAQLLRLAPGAAGAALGDSAALLGEVWPELRPELACASARESVPPASVSGATRVVPPILEQCFRDVARKSGLVIAVDDVDRADAESAALLLALARVAPTERLVVATSATSRHASTSSPGVSALRDAGSSVRLRELSQSGVTELLRLLFGDVPHVPRTGARLHEATDGNPQHCMSLLQHWVTTGVVGYAGGAWALPIDLPVDAVPRVHDGISTGLAFCSDAARRMAEAVSIAPGVVSLATCVRLAGAEGARRDAVAALEELVEAEVLTASADGYEYPQEALRVSVAAAMAPERRVELSRRFGELLVESGDHDVATAFAAGEHLIHGGERARGAELVAKTARAVLEDSSDPGVVLAPAASALEAALDVYRSEGRGNLALLEILVPLASASYEISQESAMRYGDETLERLGRALGLRGHGPVDDLGSLLSVLGSAPFLDEGEVRTESTPDVMVLVGWLIRTAMALTAVASASIDHENEERYVAALKPFTAFGPNHPASAAHEYCRLILMMTEDHFAEAHRGWSELLGRLGECGFPAAITRRLEVAATYSLGLLEAQRDDGAALERIALLDRIPSSQSAAIANQLRFLYHGFRGELALAQRSRDRVEEYAVQRGSAWQVEVWSTCTLSAVYGNTRDTAGNKRVVEQLERLKKTSPSLELYCERAVATQHLLMGDPAGTVEILEPSLSRHGARDRVGWAAVCGMLAGAHNRLEHYDVARQICEETIALASEDRDFVAMNLSLYLELVEALGGSGEIERARRELDELFARYTPNQNPMTLGSLHRVAARVAWRASDGPTFETHLAEMERYFRGTGNPALIAQCDEVRRLVPRRHGSGWQEARPVSAFAATSMSSVAQSVFAECRGADERKARALEVVAGAAGVSDAWLFTVGEAAEPVVAGRLGLSDAPADLVSEVRDLFSRSTEESDETQYFESVKSAEVSRTSVYRVCPLMVHRGGEILLVGAMALPCVSGPVATLPSFVQEVANQLFAAGDIGATYRTG